MNAPWHDAVQKVLDKDDSPVKNYPCTSEKKNGYLVITGKKLVFVQVKGLFAKTYDVVWDVPYSGLKELKPSDKYKIEVNSGDKKYVVDTGELNPKIIVTAIQDAMNAK
ncbi:MAG TPA: hypothetical protein VGB32_09375 [Candidatus Bathyarchaeia archaeon]